MNKNKPKVKAKIKIQDYEWKIIEVPTTSKPLLRKRGVCYGITIFKPQEIYIGKELPMTRKRQTLIHELCHAFLNVYMPSYQLKDKYDEEDLVSFFATHGEEIFKIVNNYFNKEN